MRIKKIWTLIQDSANSDPQPTEPKLRKYIKNLSTTKFYVLVFWKLFYYIFAECHIAQTARIYNR